MKSLVKKITPRFALSAYYIAWAYVGVLLYRNPSARVKVIGVTGTNGKTSVVHIASTLLEESGMKVGSISSLRFKIGEKEWKNEFKMTMPGRVHIQKFLRECADAGCTVVLMEVTSEGVRQKRHKGITFDTAVFTNLTPEHIESHGSFENYKRAKGEFFATPHRVSVVNADDAEADYFADFSAERTILYSASGMDMPGECLDAREVSVGPSGISFTIDTENFTAPLLGAFNVSNALGAIGICAGQGIAMATIARAFSRVAGVPGRAEIVMKRPTVVVDYAHTPDGLRKIYEMVESVREGAGKKICILGSAGGGRDKWKRPEMGAIADAFCDEIILTNEDPYDENPEAIVAHVAEGIAPGRARIIMDRREAIAEGLKNTTRQDIVVVTGKGAEPWMVVAGGHKVPWDDRAVVREEWAKIQGIEVGG
ncbi:MAG: UDP-N-acetylmuramoyl-L-alanyl-D-glutamate--2,6-diaminopimelate ligase [Candidatus Spechtbacterales bacterium]